MTHVFDSLVNVRVTRSFSMWRASALFANQRGEPKSCALRGVCMGGPGLAW